LPTSIYKALPPLLAKFFSTNASSSDCQTFCLNVSKSNKDGDGGQRWRGFLKWRTGSRLASPSISIEHVQVAQIEKNTMTVDILILGESLGQKKIVETTTLLDTGAGGKFIDQNFIRNQKIETKELTYPIEVFNVDGTPNKQGTITKYPRLDLTINGQT
jgi:hypothetical protein